MIRWTRVCVLPLMVLIVGGCELLSVFLPPTTTGSSSTLKRFTSERELVDYFKGQIDQRNSHFEGMNRGDEVAATDGDGANAGGDAVGGPITSESLADSSGAVPEAPPSPAPSEDDSGGFSQTTTQESGVEEADVVKTDGRFLYIVSYGYTNSILRIVDISAPGAMSLVSQIELDGYGRDLYLHDGKIVAVTTGGGYFYPLILESEPRPVDGGATSAGAAEGDVKDGVAAQDIDAELTVDAEPISLIAPIGDEFLYERPYTMVTVIDASTPSSPSVLSKTKFDGSQSASRMIDGVLHMVLANYQNYFFDVLPMLGRPELDLSAVDATTLLPTYTRTNADGSETSGDVVSWDQTYYPEDPDGFGVVTLVSLDVDNDGQFSAVGVVAEPGLIYSSLEAMYLTNTSYDWTGANRTTTNVYKFAYVGRGAEPVATGSVPGRILNQYSMGEHNGRLRVATTIDPTWFFDETGGGIVEESQNNVYVLQEAGESLAVVGRLENIATGESIQSARFMGDRGYLVTFEQIDPFFTLDLSDPASPLIVGELKVPGFSTYLTPIDANHVLAVGQYVPPPETSGGWGVQLSVYDVSDFANPTQSSNVIIGQDGGAYSEALWDPKAFTYFAEEGLVALPVSIYEPYIYEDIFDGDVDDVGGDDVVTSDPLVPPPDEPRPTGEGSAEGEAGVEIIEPYVPQGFDGLVVFRVSGAEGLSELGRISTRFENEGYWYASFTRGIFIDDRVLAVTDIGVRSAPVGDVSNSDEELFFPQPESPFVDEPPVPMDDVVLTDPVADPETPSDDVDAVSSPPSMGGAGTAGSTVIDE